MNTIDDEVEIEESSGNVFADVGVDEPDETLAKAKIAHAIAVTIRRRRLTQARAAMLLGIDQPKVSALVRGRLVGFSLERMLRFLTALHLDVEIRIRDPREYGDKLPGQLTVSAELAEVARP